MSDAQTMLKLEDAGLGVVGAETGMLVPLVYRQSALGMLAAFDSMVGDGEFGTEQESLLVTSRPAPRPPSRRRRPSNASGCTTRSPRRRASAAAGPRELHDDTLQGLAGLSVLLASAGPDADRANVDHKKKKKKGGGGGGVEVVTRGIQEQIEGLRTLITELRPAALDQLGLEPALESLLERAAAVEGLDVTSEIEIGRDRLDPTLETTIYRFAQEALTNVAKHARAEHLRVRLRRAPGSIEARGRRRRWWVRSRASQRRVRTRRDAGTRRSRRRHDAGGVLRGGHDRPRFVPRLTSLRCPGGGPRRGRVDSGRGR